MALALIVGACGGDNDNDTEASAGEGDEPNEQADAADTEYEIGVILSLSGPAAALGEPTLAGIEHALDTMLDGDVGISLRVVDDASQPDRAAEVAREMINDEVIAIIGPSLAANCNAIRPLIEDAGVMNYCMAGAPFEWSEHFFAAFLDPVLQLGHLPAIWMESQGYSTVGCVATNDQSGDAYLGSIEAVAPTYDLDVAAERFAPGDSTVETQLTRLRGGELDVVYSCTSGANLVTIAQSIQSLGMDVPIFAGAGSVSFAVADLVKDTLPDAGIYSVGSWVLVPEEIPDSVPNRENIQQFAQSFAEASGQKADLFAAGGADAISIIAAGLESAPTDGSELAAAVEGLSDFNGMYTSYTFTEDDHRGAQPIDLIVRFTQDGDLAVEEVIDLGNL